MFCSKCGYNNMDDSVYCERCGERLKQDTNINSFDYQNSNIHNFSNKTFMCLWRKEPGRRG